VAKDQTDPGVEPETPLTTLNASRRLARLLADAEVLRDDELISIQEQHPDEYLGDILVREGILLEGYLQGLLIRNLYIPWVAVDCCTMSPELRGLLPERLCRRRRLIPISRARDFLTVACANPLDEEALNKVHDVTGMKVRTVLCSAQDLEAFMNAAFSKPEEEELGADDEKADAEGEGDAAVAAAAAELAEQLSAGDEATGSELQPEGGHEAEQAKLDADVAAAAAELAGRLSAQIGSGPEPHLGKSAPTDENNRPSEREKGDEEPD